MLDYNKHTNSELNEIGIKGKEYKNFKFKGFSHHFQR